MPDPIDAFWVSSAAGYDGKPFKSVSQGAAESQGDPVAEGKEETAAEPSSAALASLLC